MSKRTKRAREGETTSEPTADGTVATMRPPVEPTPALEPGQPLEQLPLELLDDSPFQSADRAYEQIEELAQSIRQHGLFQPVIARRVGERFELVFGHRRKRGAIAAGLSVIPAFVRDMTDRQVIEAQVIENVQRQDVHPIVEGEGYHRLIHDHGMPVEEVMERTGRSRTVIYARMKLLELAKKVREASMSGRIPGSHTLSIARMPTHALQLAALAWLEQESKASGTEAMPSVRALDRWIGENAMVRLNGAPFDTNDPSLLPKCGACAVCPKRTGNAPPSLFPDAVGADVCTDPTCYGDKARAAGERKLAELAKDKAIKVLPPKKAEKLWETRHVNSRGDELVYDAPYVDLDAPRYDSRTGGRKAWKTTLGKDHGLPVTATLDLNGQVHLLVPKEAAEKLATKSEPKREPQAWERKQRAQSQKRKANKLVSLRAGDMALSLVRTEGRADVESKAGNMMEPWARLLLLEALQQWSWRESEELRPILVSLGLVLPPEPEPEPAAEEPKGKGKKKAAKPARVPKGEDAVSLLKVWAAGEGPEGKPSTARLLFAAVQVHCHLELDQTTGQNSGGDRTLPEAGAIAQAVAAAGGDLKMLVAQAEKELEKPAKAPKAKAKKEAKAKAGKAPKGGKGKGARRNAGVVHVREGAPGADAPDGSDAAPAEASGEPAENAAPSTSEESAQQAGSQAVKKGGRGRRGKAPRADAEPVEAAPAE